MPRRYQACGRGGALEVHHVVKRAQGGSDFDLDRLMALCSRTDGAESQQRVPRPSLALNPSGHSR